MGESQIGSLNMIEEWSDITGFEGIYQVSSKGRVRALDRTMPSGRWGKVRRKGGIINPSVNKFGYLTVGLRFNGNRKWMLVHRLVCESFHGPSPNGKPFAAHFPDPNPANNMPTNLMWASPAENSSHRKIHGTNLAGERNPSAILSEDDVRYIRSSYIRGRPRYPGNQKYLAKRFGVSVASIKGVVNMKSWIPT